MIFFSWLEGTNLRKPVIQESFSEPLNNKIMHNHINPCDVFTSSIFTHLSLMVHAGKVASLTALVCM